MTEQEERLSFSEGYSAKEQKRKHARIPVELKGSFVYKSIDSTVTDQCMITNLSTGGMAIRTGMVLIKGDVISITFTIGKNVVNEFCRVTRTHGKEVGLKFTSPSRDNVEIIQNYIYGKVFT